MTAQQRPRPAGLDSWFLVCSQEDSARKDTHLQALDQSCLKSSQKKPACWPRMLPSADAMGTLVDRSTCLISSSA